MAKLLKLRRGTTTQHGSFTGAEGEVTVDTDKETLVVHDGSTAGGHPVAAEDMANVSSASIAGRLSNDSIATSKIAAGALPSDVTVASANLVDGTIVNADVNASAAIAGTKISPDFGSQNITTTGSATSADLTLSGSNPKITFTDSNDNPDYIISGNAGDLTFFDVTNTANRLIIQQDGHVDILGNLDVGAGVDVTGDITTTGHITLGDSQNIKLGNSQDFLIYHNGSNSIINDNGTGNLEVVTNGTKITLQGGSDTMANFIKDGAVELYHDNSKKFKTTSTGVGVMGSLDVESDSQKLTIGGGQDLEIYHNGTDTGIINQTGDLYITNNGDDLLLQALDDVVIKTQGGADVSIQCFGNGGVELYADNNKRFETSGDGATLTGNLTVSGTVDGRDVASDGTKLDGIESGATADQTAQEIASALNGQAVYTTSNIGRDSTDYINWTNNTQLDVYINGSNEFRFEADGDFHADGDVIAQSTTISSDAKLKEDIELVPDALSKLNKLNGVTFKWKRSNEKSAGVIAQDVQKVLPEAVKEVTALSNGESHLSVNYHALTSILIEAVKELQAEVEKLKGGK